MVVSHVHVGSLSLPDGSIIPGDIPTVIDSLSALKLISAIMSVYFPPFDVSKYSVDPSQIDGEVSFGLCNYHLKP